MVSDPKGKKPKVPDCYSPIGHAAMENQRVNIDGREEKLNLCVWALSSQCAAKAKDATDQTSSPLALKLEGNIVK